MPCGVSGPRLPPRRSCRGASSGCASFWGVTRSRRSATVTGWPSPRTRSTRLSSRRRWPGPASCWPSGIRSGRRTCSARPATSGEAGRSPTSRTGVPGARRCTGWRRYGAMPRSCGWRPCCARATTPRCSTMHAPWSRRRRCANGGGRCSRSRSTRPDGRARRCAPCTSCARCSSESWHSTRGLTPWGWSGRSSTRTRPSSSTRLCRRRTPPARSRGWCRSTWTTPSSSSAGRSRCRSVCGGCGATACWWWPARPGAASHLSCAPVSRQPCVAEERRSRSSHRVATRWTR